MSASDLQRLIGRATPRVEDVRSPDRTDFIRREHGHLSLREIVDAVDALEFSAQAFAEHMDELLGDQDVADADVTAVHGLHRAVGRGLQFLAPGLAEPTAPSSNTAALAESDDPAASEEAAAAAKQRGAERFKERDFAGAEAEYTAAIRATPTGKGELHALYSNRSAARLQLAAGASGAASNDLAMAALADARRCVELKKDWPKGHFREGTCLRQLGFFADSARAFRAGKALEPENKDWDKEVEKVELVRSLGQPALARQLLFLFMPELLGAWARGQDPTGVLQVQLNGELSELGVAKWRLVRQGKTHPKAQVRFAFLSRKDYLANLVANLQAPPADGSVAVADVDGKPLKIADIAAFFPEEQAGCAGPSAAMHIDVRRDGKLTALLCRVPCDEVVSRFLGKRKEPDAPKGSVDSVLKLQRSSGFPKAMPRLLGFQAFPGDLNFPVIDTARDAPGECSSP